MEDPKDEDLIGSIKHLAFEFYHFGLYGHLIENATNGRNSIYHVYLFQAVGYEFLIHLRALLDFFYKSKGAKDDILAADFRALPEFISSFGEPWRKPPEWVNGVKTQLNKRLAHITSPRWKEHQPALHTTTGTFRRLAR